MYQKQTIDSFATSATATGAFDDFAGMPTPSWDFYYAAAEEPIPTYRVELAKSGRSACSAKGKAKKCCDQSSELTTKEKNNEKIFITKDTIRIGAFRFSMLTIP